MRAPPSGLFDSILNDISLFIFTPGWNEAMAFYFGCYSSPTQKIKLESLEWGSSRGSFQSFQEISVSIPLRTTGIRKLELAGTFVLLLSFPEVAAESCQRAGGGREAVRVSWWIAPT